MKKIGLLSLLVAILLSCSDAKKNEKTTPENSTAQNENVQEDQNTKVEDQNTPPAKQNIAVEEETPKSEWIYENNENKMGDVIRVASVNSKDSLEFKDQKNADAYARILIQQQGQEKPYIRFEVSKGKIKGIDPATGGNVRVRFDEEKPFEIMVQTPRDYPSIIFFTNSEMLLDKIKNAKKMLVEVSFIDEGSRQISFNVGGLTWE